MRRLHTAIRALLAQPSFTVHYHLGDGVWQKSAPMPDAAQAIADAEAFNSTATPYSFAHITRENALGQRTGRWTQQPGGAWALMSDRPGFSDVLREEIPHHNTD